MNSRRARTAADDRPLRPADRGTPDEAPSHDGASVVLVRRGRHDIGVTDDDLPASEAARARRRDRDMEAERRALLRPGMAKVFRQVTDAAAKPPTPKQQKAKRSKQK